MPGFRSILLAASHSSWLRDRATKTDLIRRSVSVFMPGERLDPAMAAASTEQAQGIGTILTRLGENLTHLEEAEDVTREYLDALNRIAAAGLRAQISVKPTQLGMDLDPEVCSRNLQLLIDRAAERDNFVWLDMESSAYTDRTLNLFRRARARSSRVGIALQAYLYRTETDLQSLLPLGPAIRIVKGAYLEPASIAFRKKSDVDENFYKLACRVLTAGARQTGAFLQIATHDERLIDRLGAFTGHGPVPASNYEHAMLYGIQRPLQRRIARAGRPLRVLISYGDNWFPWYMRRLAERPANVWFIVKSIFAR